MSGMPGTEDDAAYHVDDVMFVGEQDYVTNQFIPDLKQSFEMAEQHLTAVGSSFQFLRRTYVEIEKGLKVMPGKYAESMVEMYKEKMGRVKVQKLPCGQEVLKPDGSVELKFVGALLLGCGCFGPFGSFASFGQAHFLAPLMSIHHGDLCLSAHKRPYPCKKNGSVELKPELACFYRSLVGWMWHVSLPGET